MLIPEVGDEVLVAFEREDLRFPYVLGALWNGKDKPPLANDDGKNDKRIFKSRKKHYLLFDDGAQGVVELAHENGRQGRASTTTASRCKDEKGNQLKIESNSGAITIEANGQLKHQGRHDHDRGDRHARAQSQRDADHSRLAREHQLKDTTMGQPAARLGDTDEPRHAARAGARLPDGADRRAAGVACGVRYPCVPAGRRPEAARRRRRRGRAASR